MRARGVAGHPETKIVLEADILDDDNTFSPNQVNYAYDVFNQLLSRTYDPDGATGSQPATDTFFSHHGGQIVLQFGNNDALSHRYFWNPAAIDQLLADETVTNPQTAGSVIWPLADHLGTIRDLASHNATTDATTIENHRVYDSFGNLVSESNSAVDEVFGYTGRLFDEATGLQNNLNRWYDAKTGRWTSEDPIGFAGDPTNLYRYVNNSPMSHRDQTGLDIYIESTEQVNGMHWRITVDTYDSSGNKNGSFSISFGYNNICGVVYHDTDPKRKEIRRHPTTQKQDAAILQLFQSLLDRTGDYSVLGNNCRQFSGQLYYDIIAGLNENGVPSGTTFPLDPPGTSRPPPPPNGSSAGGS